MIAVAFSRRSAGDITMADATLYFSLACCATAKYLSLIFFISLVQNPKMGFN